MEEGAVMPKSCETKQNLLVVTERYSFILSCGRQNENNGKSSLEIVASFGICTFTVCL
jgi:hypothetical protein